MLYEDTLKKVRKQRDYIDQQERMSEERVRLLQEKREFHSKNQEFNLKLGELIASKENKMQRLTVTKEQMTLKTEENQDLLNKLEASKKVF